MTYHDDWEDEMSHLLDESREIILELRLASVERSQRSRALVGRPDDSERSRARIEPVAPSPRGLGWAALISAFLWSVIFTVFERVF